MKTSTLPQNFLPIFFQKKNLIFYLLLFYSSTTIASSPFLEISKFVNSKTETINAYDIENHFNSMMTDPVIGTIIAASPGRSTQMGIAALDENRFVVAYRDNPNSSKGMAIIGTVDGISITYGTPSQYASSVGTLNVAALSPTKFVVIIEDPFNGAKGGAYIGETNGLTSTISGFGNKVAFADDFITRIAVEALDDASFVVSYQSRIPNSSPTIVTVNTIVGQVTGNTITLGTVAKVGDGLAFNNVAVLSPTHFIVIYQDRPNNKEGAYKIGSVSGTTITLGSASNFVNSVGLFFDCTALSTSKFVIAYSDSAGNGKIKIGNFDGSTVTGFGNENTFHMGNTQWISIAPLGNNFSITYKDSDNNNAGATIVGTMNGNTSTFGNEVVFDDTEISFRTFNSSLTNSRFVAVYEDREPGTFGGKALSFVGDISGNTFTTTNYVCAEIDALIALVEEKELSESLENVLTRLLTMAKDRYEKNSNQGAINLIDRFKVIINQNTPSEISIIQATELNMEADEIIGFINDPDSECSDL